MNIFTARHIPDRPYADPFGDEDEPTPEESEQRAADMWLDALLQATIDHEERQNLKHG